MRNPFESQHKTAIAVSLAAGTLAAGAAAYLYFTESGSHFRGGITRKIKDAGKDLIAGFISEKTPISKKTARIATDHVVKS
jgi:HJR/Mrr/RecB family endonuclease